MNTEIMARGYLEDAKYSLQEAREAIRMEVYHRSIRRAQESVELSLKATLRLLGVEYPRQHEVSDLLNRIIQTRELPEWFKSELETISLTSKRLAEERGPAFYGDENASIPPKELFTHDEADKAVSEAGKIYNICSKLFDWWMNS